ncbi:MAG: hypothetical protein WCI57_04280 [Candidatus Berkelbacteria bacterium]
MRKPKINSGTEVLWGRGPDSRYWITRTSDRPFKNREKYKENGWPQYHLISDQGHIASTLIEEDLIPTTNQPDTIEVPSCIKFLRQLQAASKPDGKVGLQVNWFPDTANDDDPESKTMHTVTGEYWIDALESDEVESGLWVVELQDNLTKKKTTITPDELELF